MSDRGRASSSRPSTSGHPGKRRVPLSSSDEPGQLHSPSRNEPLQASSPTRRRYPAQSTIQAPPSPDGAFATLSRPQQHCLQRQKQQQGGKIAIPRLPREIDNASANSIEKSRVSHACEPCRQRKTKCSGERPVCKHCEDFQINCVYADGKRDRTKK